MAYIPKPIIPQQTWGNSMSQAIQRERMLQHERKLIEQEMEYKKTRDIANDQRWNKEFDIRSAAAKTHNEILKQNAVRSAKRNEQLEMELDRMRTQAIQDEKHRGLVGHQAKDQMMHKKYDDIVALKRQQANQWGAGSKDASDWLAKERQRTGVSPAGSGGGWWDYLTGSTERENQGLARGMKESQPGYVSRDQYASQMIDDMGGSITPQTYQQIMGTSFNQANQAAAMPDAAAINYVNQANAPQQGTIQQMYQNAQPVQMQQPAATPQQSVMGQGYNMLKNMAIRNVIPWYMR